MKTPLPGSRRPRLVFVAQVPPTSDGSGPKRRNRQIIQALLDTYDIRLLAFVRSRDEHDSLMALTTDQLVVTPVWLWRSRWLDVWHLTRSLLLRLPFLVARDWTEAMERAVREAAEEAETVAVHIDQLSMACYLPIAKAARRIVVVDEHNVVWTLVAEVGTSYRWWSPKRLVALRDARRLRRFEAEICAKADLVLAVNTADAAQFTEMGAKSVRVVPIAMPVTGDEVERPEVAMSTVLIIGTMYYPPNAIGAMWFLNKVLPMLRGTDSQLRVLIVGARPPDSLLAAARVNSDVRVLGYVEDLEYVFRTATMLAVPLLAGGGTRVKILEAFAHRLPVIATTPGYRGLDVVPGRELLVADDPRDFAASVKELTTNAALRRSLADEGYRFVRTSHALAETAAAVNSAYSFVLKG
ncbi:glycosyltransferase [bacterium]|nr:MAG: glycosyltransferase [bacterium]